MCALFMWLLFSGIKLLIQILNKPSVTDLLFQAVLCELSVVGQGRHQLILGDFNVEPSKIPCLVEGISEGSLIDFDDQFFAGRGNLPASTCKNVWDSVGTRRTLI